jgi:hypothetical protein
VTPREGFIDRVKAPCFGFAHSENPRIRSCAKCGRAPENHRAAPEATVDPTRDLRFEDDFFHEAVTYAQRATGISNLAYVPRVQARLQVGRERYGDANYMEKDVLQEVLDETPDIAGYAVLELHKQRALGLDEFRFRNLYHDLLAATAYGVVADFYAQRAARRLAGESK